MSGSIAEHFRKWDYPRRDQGKWHGLTAIVTITILGAWAKRG